MRYAYLQRILDQGRGRCRYFGAVDSILPVHYIEQVFPRLNIPDDARIFYEVRATLTGPQLETLRRCRVIMVQCGIEALDTPTLRMLKKGMTGPGNLRFLRECCETGVSVLWNLICGIPGEDIRRLYSICLSLFQSCFISIPRPVYGASATTATATTFGDREDYGLSLTPSTAALSNAFPFEARELQQIAYFYENNRISEIMTREKIKLIQKINSEIVRWQNRWKAEDEGSLPRLYWTDFKNKRLIDTRGEAREYSLSPEAAALLDYLQAPRPDAALRARFASQTLSSAWRECAEHDLIWREESSALSVSLATKGRPALPKPFSTLDSWVWE